MGCLPEVCISCEYTKCLNYKGGKNMLDKYINEKLVTNKIKGEFKDRSESVKNIDPNGKAFYIKFPNGWGASVISHRLSYGNKDEWELAVIKWEGDDKWELNYTHPESKGDVRGYLSPEEVYKILVNIANTGEI